MPTKTDTPKPEDEIQQGSCGGSISTALFSKFIVAPHLLQFRCKTAVYYGDAGKSLCYVTSDEVGQFVAAAMNHFKETGAMDKYLQENA